MELAEKAALTRWIAAHGLPPTLDGPRLERFDAGQLSKALKQEIARAHAKGQTKIVVTMDLMDALRLAYYLEAP